MVLAAYAYFTSAFSYDSWGWTPGPRHLTPLVPFLLLPAGLAIAWLEARAERWASALRGAAAGLCAVSVALTGLVAMVNYVPPEVSTAPFGLALPLFRSGWEKRRSEREL